MKTPTLQRDETLLMLCNVLEHLADEKANFTAQSFVSRARANLRCGNFDRAFEYANIARSYIMPEKVTA